MTEAEVMALMTRILVLVDDRNTAFDTLNATIEGAEQAFRELKLGCPAEVWMDKTHALGFGKVKDKWRLYLRSIEDEGDEGDGAGRMPLHQSALKWRLEASSFLDKLLVALVAAGEKQLDRMGAAAEEIDAFVGRLQRSMPNPETE